jgi:hypothetical protein
MNNSNHRDRIKIFKERKALFTVFNFKIGKRGITPANLQCIKGKSEIS